MSGTWDFIDEADRILREGDEVFILFVGSGKSTRIVSNHAAENREMLERWIDSGFWNDLLRKHLENLY